MRVATAARARKVKARKVVAGVVGSAAQDGGASAPATPTRTAGGAGRRPRPAPPARAPEGPVGYVDERRLLATLGATSKGPTSQAAPPGSIEASTGLCAKAPDLRAARAAQPMAAEP